MFYISEDSIQNIKFSLLDYHLETKIKLKLTEDIKLNSRKALLEILLFPQNIINKLSPYISPISLFLTYVFSPHTPYKIKKAIWVRTRLKIFLKNFALLDAYEQVTTLQTNWNFSN
jgi:hypothetical protein